MSDAADAWKFSRLDWDELAGEVSRQFQRMRDAEVARVLASRRVRWSELASAACGYWPDGAHCYVNGRIGGLTAAFQETDSLHTTNAKGCKCGAVVEGPPTPSSGPK